MGPLLAMLAAAGPFGVAPVPDGELAAHRGGFRLPNGIEVALTVQTQTAIDGAVVLRTVFRADEGTPTFTVYAPRAGERVGAPHGGDGAAGHFIAPVLRYDRATGITVVSPAAGPNVEVGSAGGDQAEAIPAGLVQVDAASGAATDAGTVHRTDGAGLHVVDLRGADLSITHFAGNAFGSAILNSADGRAIDTQTTVGVTLSNVSPDTLGSSMFRTADIAADAIQMRLR